MKKIFIDKDINVLEGHDAQQKLLEKNDKQYFIENVGVSKVDSERWKEAQDYEKKTWCDSPAKELHSDRNEQHERAFSGYNQLNFLLKNEISIIELGCGPYTNVRVILQNLIKKFKKIDLLDPLINEYCDNSPNCTYTTKRIFGQPVNLINSSIEDFQNTETYDLIIMLNVLEHCYDADKIFDKIRRLMNKDSIFVFHDKFYLDSEIENSLNNVYDAGHPIKLSVAYFREQLDKFSILYQNVVDDDDHKNYYMILKLK